MAVDGAGDEAGRELDQRRTQIDDFPRRWNRDPGGRHEISLEICTGYGRNERGALMALLYGGQPEEEVVARALLAA